MRPDPFVPLDQPSPYGRRPPSAQLPPLGPPRGGRRFPHAFSLIELLVVIAIVAIAAAVAVPNLIAWSADLRLDSAAGELRAGLMSAKSVAAKENTTVTVQFYPATGSYSIKHTNLDGNPVLLKATALPPGVRIAPESTMAGSKTSFTSRGGADAGTMVLTNSGGKKKSIAVSSLGKVTVKD